MVQQANQQYYYGTGKRKTAIARVRLYPGEAAQDQVNGKPLDEAITWPIWRQQTQEPLRVTNLRDRFTIRAKVQGGGPSAQADAIRHGIAWALVAYDETLKPELRRHGFLTRDMRIKESKKYGLKRARRAPQYTKR